MTTPAQPERPERMTDERLASAQMEWRSMEAELDRARAEETRLTRELALSERLIDAFARELGTLVCQVSEADTERIKAQTERDRLRGVDSEREEWRREREYLISRNNEEIQRRQEAEKERDAAMEEARRLRLMLNGTPETCATTACDKPSVRGGYCFDCYHGD